MSCDTSWGKVDVSWPDCPSSYDSGVSPTKRTKPGGARWSRLLAGLALVLVFADSQAHDWNAAHGHPLTTETVNRVAAGADWLIRELIVVDPQGVPRPFPADRPAVELATWLITESGLDRNDRATAFSAHLQILGFAGGQDALLAWQFDLERTLLAFDAWQRRGALRPTAELEAGLSAIPTLASGPEVEGEIVAMLHELRLSVVPANDVAVVSGVVPRLTATLERARTLDG